MPIDRRTPRPIGFAAAAVLALVAAPLHAQSLPWQAGATLSVTHDDNVFRAPPGQEVGDRSLSAGVFGSVDLRLGRQRLLGTASLRDNRYADRSDLDHGAYGLGLTWDGETVGAVSWQLSYLADRNLSSYANTVEAARRVANLEDSRQLLARLQLGLVSQWAVSAEASRRSIDYSAAAYEAEEYRLDTFGAGIVWNPAGALSVTLRPRWTDGRYPNVRVGGQPAPLAFDRRDVDLLMRWSASGASTVNARLSWTDQQYTEGSERDFDGATGQLSWSWAVTGKTRLNAVAARDTGSESSFFSFDVGERPLRGVGDTGRVTTSLSVGVDHQLTGKISISGQGAYVRRRLSAGSRLLDPGLSLGSSEGVERTGSVRVGLRYSPTVRSSLGCDAGYEKRGTDTTLSSPFVARTISCSGQLSLR